MGLGISLAPRSASLADLGPMSIAPTSVEALADAVDSLTSLGLRHGGRLILEAAKGQLRYAMALHDQAPTDRLADVVGRLADRAAWALSEVGQHGQARRVFRLAVDVAATLTTRDAIRVNLAGHHLTTGDPLGAIGLLPDVPDDLPVFAFVAHATLAHAHAALGDLQGAMREIARADSAHAAVSLPNLPEAYRPFASGHAAHADREAGSALFALALRYPNRRTIARAEERLNRAIELFGPERSHAAERCRQRLFELVG